MSRSSSSTPRYALAIRKFLLSFFVVFTFIAYAMRSHTDTVDPTTKLVPSSKPVTAQGANSLVMNVATTVPTAIPNVPVATVGVASPNATSPTNVFAELPTILPTNVPATPVPVLPTATPDSIYKDGTYIGPVVDAYYGNVQVEAIVQGGKITTVQFLDYPQDRRTSRFINQQATPWLTEEAVQVQSANVDLISGATFTSQAFVMSLDSALRQAHV